MWAEHTNLRRTPDEQLAAAAFAAAIVAAFLAASLGAALDQRPSTPVAAPAPTPSDRASVTFRLDRRPAFDQAHAARRAGRGPIARGSRIGATTLGLGPFEVRWPPSQ